MAKSKKLEKLGFTKVDLFIDPNTVSNYRMPRLTFHRSEWTRFVIEFQQHALDGRDPLTHAPRDVFAGAVLELRAALGDFSEIMNIGRRPWSLAYAGKVEELRIETAFECEAIIDLLDWVKKQGGAHLLALVKALREESVSFRVHYGIDPKTDKPIDRWDLPDECIGKTNEWAYGPEANEALAKHYAEQAQAIRDRAARNAAQQEVA